MNWSLKMELSRTAQEITPTLQNQAGGVPKNWRSERIFTASKRCKLCGETFNPWIKRDAGGKLLSACPEPTWEKQDFCSISCSKKFANPMSNHQTRLKLKQRLREIKHRPIKRGGNGQLLPLAQLALLHALGDGWESEVVVPTKMPKDSGYPTSYKIDIANTLLMIGVEVDGPSHGTLNRQAQDAKKTDLLVSLGWSVYRVSNKEALHLYSTFTSTDTFLLR